MGNMRHNNLKFEHNMTPINMTATQFMAHIYGNKYENKIAILSTRHLIVVLCKY